MSLPQVRLGYRVEELKTGPFGSALSSGEYSDEGVPLVNPSDLRAGRIWPESAVKVPETVAVRMAAYRVQSGDLLLGRRGELGRYGIVGSAEVGFLCGTGCLLVRPGAALSQQYLGYVLETATARDWLSLQSVGSTMENLNEAILSRLPIPNLSFDKQLGIANFLDEQMARIDALITEKERLSERLRELHLSSLWQQVTKGVQDAPMQASGVEWIGECPRHWNVMAIKWLTPVLRGASPRPIDDPKYFDDNGEYGWVRIADVSASNGLLMSTEQQLSALGASLSVKREPGDLFLSIAGTVGKPCIAGIKCCIHDGFVWFPSVGHALLRDWLFAIFESGFAYAGLGKMGTQLNLNTDTVGSIRIPVPPEAEMAQILEQIASAKAANHSLRNHVEEHIARLREYRSSLISAAVTGQLDLSTFKKAVQ